MPSIFTLSESGIHVTVPETLTDLRLDRDWNMCEVPNKMTTDLDGLRAIQFSQNQLLREFKHEQFITISPRLCEIELRPQMPLYACIMCRNH